MEEKRGVITTYLRYSKRIVIFGLIIWLVTMITIIGLVYWLSFEQIVLDEYIASVVKAILTSSSSVTITTVGAYYIHSGVEKITSLQQKIKTLQNLDNLEESEGGSG